MQPIGSDLLDSFGDQRRYRGRTAVKAMELSIFCGGNASRKLTEAVARAIGVPVGAAAVDRFPDGEVRVQLRDTVHKTRETGTETHVMHLVGDVRGRPCLMVDDMISTGGTIAESVEVLLRAGARPGIFVAATHGLLLDSARAKLTTESMADIFVTDTIERTFEDWPRLHVVSVAPLIAEAIQKVTADRLVGDPV